MTKPAKAKQQHESMEERLKSLEEELKSANKKAAIIAFIAVLVGGSGGTGIAQFVMGSKTERAEAALKDIEKKYKDQKEQLALQTAEYGTALQKIALNHKEQGEQQKAADAKIEYQMKQIQAHKATIEQLQADLAVSKSQDSDVVVRLRDQLRSEILSFNQFLNQTRTMTQQTQQNCVPSWYQTLALSTTQEQQGRLSGFPSH